MKDLQNIKQRFGIIGNYVGLNRALDIAVQVAPTDLSVLEQRYDGRYLTLVTCSPPGTYLRRLIVKARIVDI